MSDPNPAPAARPSVRSARAPGRCTVVGDHTDYSLGRSLTAALNLGTTVSFHPGPAGLLVGGGPGEVRGPTRRGHGYRLFA